MTLGSRTRRASAGFAVLTIFVLGGCHAMPLGRLPATPNSPQSTLASASRAALLPATVAMDPPSEMSSIEPVKTSPTSITPAEIPPPIAPTRPAPTPLLDAALERANKADEVTIGESGKPESQPTTPQASPAPVTPSPIQFPVTIPSRPMTVVVEASSDSKPKETEPKPKEPEPARPEDLWRDGVRKLGSLARAKLEQSGGTSSAAPWSLRARILAWLAEPDIDPELGQRDADGVRSVLRALDEPSTETPRRGDEIRSAVLVLEDRAPLEIVDLRLCSKVDGFGDFEPIEPPVRKAGQPVILYCEIDGLRFEQTSAGFRTRIAAQLEILPEGGGPPVFTRSLSTAEETCRRRRRDYSIAYRLMLPKPLEPGDYRIRLTERDLNSDRSASREVSFAIARD